MNCRVMMFACACAFMVVGMVVADPILDAASSRVSFQARITQQGGVPLDGQDIDIEFRLYDGGGLLLGPGILVPAVPVGPGGLLNVMVPFDPANFDGEAREVGVSINGGAELSPRFPIGAVPYAYRTNRVTSAELDDFLTLGAPGDSGGLTIHGPQATPTFFLDGIQNSLTLASDDGSGTVDLLAENGAPSVSTSVNGQPRAALDGEGGDVWARSTVNVGTIASPLSDSTPYASLQFGVSFGGRMLAWDPFRELTTVVGSTAGSAGGGLLQLYRGGTGGLTVEIAGDDGNGSGQGIWRDADANDTVRISGEDHRIYTYGADDAEHARLGGAGSGNLQLRAGGAANPMTVNVNAGGGGEIDLLDSGGADFGVRLAGGTSSTGGRIRVYDDGNTNTVEILGENAETGSGHIVVREGSADSIVLDAANNRIQLFAPAPVETVRVFGNGAGGGGGVSLRNDAGDVTIELDGDETASDSGVIRVRRGDGTAVFVLNADSRALTGRGARALFQNDSGQNTVELEGDESNSGVLRLRRADGVLGVQARATEGTGSELNLYDAGGNATIQFDTDWSGTGNSRIVTNEIEITGGSDLSERFDVSGPGGSAEPGTVVCIDSDHPGKLAVCSEAYDKKVAGIVSGAGGVKTGMYMEQAGSEADGKLPVALTGRVYCRVDALNGAIEPGDLLTTSNVAGYAMKVTDHSHAHGATIGKAMTGLEEGKGLVLVLVNLH